MGGGDGGQNFFKGKGGLTKYETFLKDKRNKIYYCHKLLNAIDITNRNN